MCVQCYEVEEGLFANWTVQLVFFQFERQLVPFTAQTEAGVHVIFHIVETLDLDGATFALQVCVDFEKFLRRRVGHFRKRATDIRGAVLVYVCA